MKSHLHAGCNTAGCYDSAAIDYSALLAFQALKHDIGFALIPEVAVKDDLKAGLFKLLPFPEILIVHGLLLSIKTGSSAIRGVFKTHVMDYFENQQRGNRTG
jgi:DNA-binding transcriptional LysR family regulator